MISFKKLFILNLPLHFVGGWWILTPVMKVIRPEGIFWANLMIFPGCILTALFATFYLRAMWLNEEGQSPKEALRNIV